MATKENTSTTKGMTAPDAHSANNVLRSAIRDTQNGLFDLRAMTLGAAALIDVDDSSPEASSLLHQIAARLVVMADAASIADIETADGSGKDISPIDFTGDQLYMEMQSIKALISGGKKLIRNIADDSVLEAEELLSMAIDRMFDLQHRCNTSDATEGAAA